MAGLGRRTTRPLDNTNRKAYAPPMRSLIRLFAHECVIFTLGIATGFVWAYVALT